MENLQFYLLCLVAIIAGVLLVKKFVGCIIRSAIFLIVVIIIALAYTYLS